MLRNFFLRLARVFAGKKDGLSGAAESAFSKREEQLSEAERKYLLRGGAGKAGAR